MHPSVDSGKWGSVVRGHLPHSKGASACDLRPLSSLLCKLNQIFMVLEESWPYICVRDCHRCFSLVLCGQNVLPLTVFMPAAEKEDVSLTYPNDISLLCRCLSSSDGCLDAVCVYKHMYIFPVQTDRTQTFSWGERIIGSHISNLIYLFYFPVGEKKRTFSKNVFTFNRAVVYSTTKQIQGINCLPWVRRWVPSFPLFLTVTWYMKVFCTVLPVNQ